MFKKKQNNTTTNKHFTGQIGLPIKWAKQLGSKNSFHVSEDICGNNSKINHQRIIERASQNAVKILQGPSCFLGMGTLVVFWLQVALLLALSTAPDTQDSYPDIKVFTPQISFANVPIPLSLIFLSHLASVTQHFFPASGEVSRDKMFYYLTLHHYYLLNRTPHLSGGTSLITVGMCTKPTSLSL